MTQESQETHKVYENGGGAAVHLGVKNKKLVGRILVWVPCDDPAGKGFPFGFHAWLILPGEKYSDLRCECLDKKQTSAGSRPSGNVRSW